MDRVILGLHYNRGEMFQRPSRRAFLLSTVPFFERRRAYGQWSTPLLMLTTREAAALRERISDAHREELRALADKALKAGPWSVTFHRPKHIAVPEHEYFSEGPYWWPNPKNPKGPYIRRDGERNPDRFDENHRDLGTLGSAVLALGMGAYLLKDERYVQHASGILTTWFVDPKTRMNPNLEYGQAIRGISAGRGTGLIDTVSLIYAVQGMALLDHSGLLDKGVTTALRQWFREFLQWMMTSRKGRDESKSGNNHATWWTAQVAAYAGFIGDRATFDMAWDHYRKYLVPTEIRPDGSCPREEARTQSLSYSTYNLDAFSVICRLAQLQGADLWHFRAPNDVGVEKAIAYIRPYVEHPENWPKQQITPFEPDRIVFPGLAAVGLDSADLLHIYNSLPRAQTAWVLLVDLIVRGA